MIPPSIFPDAGMLRGAAGVLGRVEQLPADATGVLRFGDVGTVLVESRSVCWAVATGMEQRLTELLRHQRSPPLDRRFLEGVVQRCRTSGMPLGEALLASGEITTSGLRSALFRQAVEAIAHIARHDPRTPEFTPRTRSTYDARFAFSTAEIFAALGARRDHALATAARRHLESVLAPETTAIAFIRLEELRVPEVIAVVHPAGCRVETLCEACEWADGLFEVVSTADPDAFLATGAWGGAAGSASAVVWRTPPAHFAALCTTRAAAAVLASRLADRHRAGTLR